MSATPSALTRERLEAEEIAARLPGLMVAADRVAMTVAQGVHGRRRVGVGETFWQYRNYQPGDATSRIDWRQSARSDHVFVRELEWEAAETVWMWRDASPSMAFSSRRDLVNKHDRATVIALALAALLGRAGERVAWLGDGLRPVGGRDLLERLARQVIESGHGQDPATLDLSVPRNARLVIISDFFRPIDWWQRRVRLHAGAGVRGHLVQVIDPAEEALPYHGRMLFEGMDSDQHALIRNVDAVRSAYRSRFDAHGAALRDLARRFGWTFFAHRSDAPPEAALLALYEALATKGI